MQFPRNRQRDVDVSQLLKSASGKPSLSKTRLVSRVKSIMLPATRITQVLSREGQEHHSNQSKSLQPCASFTCLLCRIPFQPRQLQSPASITAPAVTTLTKANLGAMNTSLSTATRDNTTTAELSVASTKWHRKRKAGEEESEGPIPKGPGSCTRAPLNP
jgi:hypothetical protein